MKTLWITTMVAVVAIVSLAQAGHRRCCSQCGCSNVKSVCRLVQETKKVTTFQYDSECSEYCQAGPSPVVCKKTVCDCSWLGHHIEKIWGKPCYCGHPRHRKNLVKIPVTKEIKVWTCKLERVCCGCGVCLNSQLGTEAETQAFVAQAQQQGILPVEDQQEVILPIAEPLVFEPSVVDNAQTESTAVKPVSVSQPRLQMTVGK